MNAPCLGPRTAAATVAIVRRRVPGKPAARRLGARAARPGHALGRNRPPQRASVACRCGAARHRVTPARNTGSE